MEPKIPVYILAGGRSSRFGSDKALADAGGTPLILRVVEQWRPWASRIVVVADLPHKYAACGLETIADLQSGLGPLGGLATALEDRGEGWLALAACDALVQPTSLLAKLVAATIESVQVVALRGAQWEPLPALYHGSMLPTVKASLAHGEGSLWRMIEQVPHKAIPLHPEAESVAHINSSGDLADYLRQTPAM